MLEQITFTSNKNGQDVTLKSLIDTPFRFMIAKIIELNIKEKEYVGSFQYVMKISTQNKIIKIFNKLPGFVEELFVQANDIVTIQSVLYNLTYQNQDSRIHDIQLVNPIKKHPKIRINIINNKQSQEQTQKEFKKEKLIQENHYNIQSQNHNLQLQIENHSQIVNYVIII
ncbi:unnamed protein product [Paramecium sonneborni]|uniref:Uncharacterized protein n=1 Tax=Paramecium sonneborni TaxID=65129 RepID=A0A8S1RBS1_9CILI|nr:unnamed protein product [Paramecium sonneborni]